MKVGSMKCGAMSSQQRQSISNIHFISAIPKKDGASGVSLLPAIVRDLRALENGVVMYSAELNEDVLVAAPLLWIVADMPCHSESCGLQNPSTTLYPCRKCYMRIRRTKHRLLEPMTHYTENHVERNKDHYLIAFSTPDRRSTIYNVPSLNDKQ